MVKNVVESEQYSWQGIDFKEEKQKPSQMGILCIKSKALLIKRLSLSLITWQKIECGCSRIWRSKSPSTGEWHDRWPRDKVDYNVFGFPKKKRKGTTRRWQLTVLRSQPTVHRLGASNQLRNMNHFWVLSDTFFICPPLEEITYEM